MLQPYIEQIVQALVGLLVLFLLSVVTKVKLWIAARTTAAQREALGKIAAEGMALVEATYKDLDGPKKLSKAINYVTARIAWSGIDEATIRAAVEKAVLDYNAQVKGGGAGA